MKKQEQDKLKDLIKKVINWANERGIIAGTERGIIAQYDYIHKELTELQDALKWKRKVEQCTADSKPFDFVITESDNAKTVVRYIPLKLESTTINHDASSSQLDYNETIELIEAEIKDGFGDVIVTLINWQSCIWVYQMSRISNELAKYIKDQLKTKNYEAIVEACTVDESESQQAFSLIEYRFLLERNGYAVDLSIDVALSDVWHICKQHGYDPIECLEKAYNEIKDRTGKKVNGQYEKD